MRKLAALCGALLMTLVLAGPAAANQKVLIPDFSTDGTYTWQEEVSLANPGWGEGWECRGPGGERLWYNGAWNGSFWLWYKNSVDTTDPNEYRPTDRPWPWIKGEAKGSGVDTYSTLPDKGGKVLSGKYNSVERFYDHEWTQDWEKWHYQRTGKYFGINAPGMGTVFHESGNLRFTLEQFFENGEFVGDDLYDYRWVGNSSFGDPFFGDNTAAVEELCDYFGYTAAFE